MSPGRPAGINWAAAGLGGAGILAAVESLRLGIGGPGEPGPGLLSFAAATVLAGSCAAVVFRERVPAGAFRPLATPERLGAAAVLLGGALAFEPLGYRLTIALTVTLLLRVLGTRRWLLAGAIGVVAAVSSYVLFADLLGMVLPRGPGGV